MKIKIEQLIRILWITLGFVACWNRDWTIGLLCFVLANQSVIINKLFRKDE